jgi:hypothetical protein
LREKFQRACRTVRRSSQTFSLDILPNGAKHFAIRLCDSVELLSF